MGLINVIDKWAARLKRKIFQARMREEISSSKEILRWIDEWPYDLPEKEEDWENARQVILYAVGRRIEPSNDLESLDKQFMSENRLVQSLRQAHIEREVK
jgi:hypothetical protein